VTWRPRNRRQRRREANEERASLVWYREHPVQNHELDNYSPDESFIIEGLSRPPTPLAEHNEQKRRQKRALRRVPG
jgi:hypothetical protein